MPLAKRPKSHILRMYMRNCLPKSMPKANKMPA
jgi:hypothetical protein